MTFDDFAARLASFITFWAHLVVCAFAAKLYHRRPLRPVLLIAISSGLGALVPVLAWVVQWDTDSAHGFWYLLTAVGVVNIVMWAIGCYLLFRDYESRDRAA